LTGCIVPRLPNDPLYRQMLKYMIALQHCYSDCSFVVINMRCASTSTQQSCVANRHHLSIGFDDPVMKLVPKTLFIALLLLHNSMFYNCPENFDRTSITRTWVTTTAGWGC
jgi:hypothetical protein